VSIPLPQSRIPGAPSVGSGRSKRQAIGKWLGRILIGLLAVLLAVYLLGRIVEPARARLVSLPGIGQALFGAPVWRLSDWLKSAPKTPEASQTKPSAANVDMSGLESELSAKLGQISLKEQAATQKEAELKAREERLDERQQAVESREAQLKKQEANLSQLEVVRAMKPAAVTELFTQLSDTEALNLLRYMENEEVAQILGNLPSPRAATLFRKLGELRQQPSPAGASR
jgi:flagellar motility protein MotE (MotC chaperone)